MQDQISHLSSRCALAYSLSSDSGKNIGHTMGLTFDPAEVSQLVAHSVRNGLGQGSSPDASQFCGIDLTTLVQGELLVKMLALKSTRPLGFLPGSVSESSPMHSVSSLSSFGL